MKITVLIENTEGICGTVCEHGLSVYVETKERRVLVDTGASGMAMENAKVLGVDIEKVDALVLSHGHYDHTGGVLKFAEENKNAKIYLHKNATRDFLNGKGNHIGVDPEILKLKQLNFTDKQTKVFENVEIFTDIKGRKYFPEGNKTLKVFVDGNWIQDDFSHEQCVVIKEDEKTLLLSGCAHSGILNILDRYHEIYNDYPTAVISGFHMMKADGYDENDRKIIEGTAEELAKLPTLFFTGHCTHHEPYEMMKPILGDKITEICTGFTIEI